jgi:hypothetical protein
VYPRHLALHFPKADASKFRTATHTALAALHAFELSDCLVTAAA